MNWDEIKKRPIFWNGENNCWVRVSWRAQSLFQFFPHYWVVAAALTCHMNLHWAAYVPCGLSVWTTSDACMLAAWPGCAAAGCWSSAAAAFVAPDDKETELNRLERAKIHRLRGDVLQCCCSAWTNAIASLSLKFKLLAAVWCLYVCMRQISCGCRRRARAGVAYSEK